MVMVIIMDQINNTKQQYANPNNSSNVFVFLTSSTRQAVRGYCRCLPFKALSKQWFLRQLTGLISMLVSFWFSRSVRLIFQNVFVLNNPLNHLSKYLLFYLYYTD